MLTRERQRGGSDGRSSGSSRGASSGASSARCRPLRCKSIVRCRSTPRTCCSHCSPAAQRAERGPRAAELRWPERVRTPPSIPSRRRQCRPADAHVRCHPP
jgi:hypothetical protein